MAVPPRLLGESVYQAPLDKYVSLSFAAIARKDRDDDCLWRRRWDLFGGAGGFDEQGAGPNRFHRNRDIAADNLPVAHQLLDRVPRPVILFAERRGGSPIETFQGGTSPITPGASKQEKCQCAVLGFMIKRPSARHLVKGLAPARSNGKNRGCRLVDRAIQKLHPA